MSEQMTNDNVECIVKTVFDGPILEFDFPSLHIGVAEYENGLTGCTVFYFPETAQSVSDIRGGMPGTLQGAPHADGETSAICFAGGSLYGLEAVTGVSSELLVQNHCDDIYAVRGAIIYDFFNRNWIYPDKTLGRAALKVAQPGVFPLGARGAGRSASVGKWLLKPYEGESAGQGGAFYQRGQTKVAVFTVVNAIGAIVDREGTVVRGNFNPETGQRDSVPEAARVRSQPKSQNTTLTLVVTNQKMDLDPLRQLARHVHSSMTRAIYPFHTPADGDVLFAATTNEIENEEVNPFFLSHIASELAWDAVLACY